MDLKFLYSNVKSLNYLPWKNQNSSIIIKLLNKFKTKFGSYSPLWAYIFLCTLFWHVQTNKLVYSDVGLLIFIFLERYSYLQTFCHISFLTGKKWLSYSGSTPYAKKSLFLMFKVKNDHENEYFSKIKNGHPKINSLNYMCASF